MNGLKSIWHLGSRAGSLFSARMAAALLGIGVQLLLARLLGPEQLGQFFLATSLATVGAVVAAGGFPNIVLKIVAMSRNGERRGEALARVALIDSAAAGFVIAVLMASAALLLSGHAALLAAAIAVPVIAFGRLLSAYAMARRHPMIANLPELLTRPVVLASGLVLLLLAGVRIDATDAVWLFTVGAALTLILLTVGMVRAGILPRVEPRVDRRIRRRLRMTALPLVSVSVLSAFFGDLAIIVSSLFLSPAALGVFALSLKIALLVGFAIQALYQIELPRIAAAHGRALSDEVRRIVGRLNRTAMLATGSAALVLAPLAPQVLALFGEAFVAGAPVLAILVVVQVARACCGPSIQALTLLSAQRTSSLLSLASGLVLLAGCAALAASFGPTGAAIATGVAMLTWYGLAAHFAARYGLATFGLGISRNEIVPWRAVLRWRSP